MRREDAKSQDQALAVMTWFLGRLDEGRISYRLDHVRPESIMVTVALPRIHWEIEFFPNGDVEAERFAGDDAGVFSVDQSWLEAFAVNGG